MSLLARIFSNKKDEDYETILSSLANDIQKRQVKLSEIRLRERRSTLLVTLYTLGIWVAYVSLWYMQILPSISGQPRTSRPERLIKGVPAVVGPILILFVRRIVQIWYKRKGDAEEKMLQTLLKQQRSKVEEIKKKTNYYSTRELLQRYDESPVASPIRQRVAPASNQPNTPQRQQPVPTPNSGAKPQTPQSQTPGGNPSPSPNPFLTGPPRKQWYDKLADALLGDEDQVAGANATRYALICENCFAHNGLVKESMWEDAQYVCPKCNHFNRSHKSKTQATGTPHAPTKSRTPTPEAAPTATAKSPLGNGNGISRRSESPVTQENSMMEIDS
ncbi:hypothetical protein BD779DRAFT_1528850 [Infundibulicybe gibba]|nr:hypothetical protein BD779DRAFT_1528850 [Infundibulicybe gibba]